MLPISPNTPSTIYCRLFEDAGFGTLEYLGTTAPISKCEFNKEVIPWVPEYGGLCSALTCTAVKTEMNKEVVFVRLQQLEGGLARTLFGKNLTQFW
jgi:hypothetical protein